MRRYKSFLYVPADSEKLLAGAASRGADALILDLEDAVAESRKDAARAAAVDYLSAAPADGPDLWVRVNPGETGDRDLEALVGVRGLTGVWIAKAEPGPELVARLARLDAAGHRAGLMLESAAGVGRLRELPELPEDALVQPGEIDLAASLGIAGDEDQLEVYRALVVLECAARGLPAPVAPVSASWTEPAYRAGSERLRARGFVGRACIHPAQVATANDVWSVSDDERARARAVLREFEGFADAGVGAFRASDGSMVDRATVRWARAVLEGG